MVKPPRNKPRMCPCAPADARGGMQGDGVALVGAFNPSKIAAYFLRILERMPNLRDHHKSKPRGAQNNPYPLASYWFTRKTSQGCPVGAVIGLLVYIPTQ